MNRKQYYKKYYSCKYNRQPAQRKIPSADTGSKGEQRIREILKKNFCQYQEQKTFEDLKDKKPLRFDFSLEFNGKVICLIEYQGEQHFKPVSYFGGQEGFINLKKHDLMKQAFCAQNNIPLFYINYDEDLDKKLEQIIQWYSIYKWMV